MSLNNYCFRNSLFLLPVVCGLPSFAPHGIKSLARGLEEYQQVCDSHCT